MAKYQVITPGKNKESIDILYGYHSTIFGKALIGVTTQSICHLSFCDFETSAIKILKKEWPQAYLKKDRLTTAKIVRNIFDTQIPERSFSLLVRGTDFQIKVWQALISISTATTTSYANIAHIIGKPKAIRAAANAIANNPISYLIPCHRVIRKSGKIHKYRWGVERKKAILAYEALLYLSISKSLYH
ncbi:MAG: methylated-DNA--[protein]-cysteine S-methyltransferase [Wolbachia sp.]